VKSPIAAGDAGNSFFHSIFQYNPLGIVIVDEQTTVVDSNKAMFRYFSSEAPLFSQGMRFGNLFNCETVANSSFVCGTTEKYAACAIRQGMLQALQRQLRLESAELSHRFIMNGRADTKWFEVTASPVIYNELNYALVLFNDISDKKRREEALVKIGVTDGLTGLYNRKFIFDQVTAFLQSSKDECPVASVAMLDIDDFKRVNDTYGHLAGDDVLKELARILKGGIRYSDYAGRYGGEEFLLVFPDTVKETAVNIVERIKSRFNKSTIGKVEYPLSFSAGVVEIPLSSYDGDRTLEIIGKADELMYEAKKGGKDRVVAGNYERPA
jgi:diguanylate cyclase (GGDEF)-like protein